MFAVFDCTKTVGTTCYMPNQALAWLASVVLSAFTGRFHDYA